MVCLVCVVLCVLFYVIVRLYVTFMCDVFGLLLCLFGVCVFVCGSYV